jgi:hypothetical protein
MILKIICTICFSLTASNFYDRHQVFIDDPGCNGYVNSRDAFAEYLALTSYFMFTLTQLIDIRDARAICYPRSSSGECEPLNPENFKVGGKYEHCRAYELRQRQLKGWK